MKRTILAAAVLAAAVAAAGAVTLENGEAVSFWYVVDPSELTGLTATTSRLPTRVADFFAAGDAAGFRELAPGASVALAGLPEGTHLVVGFFELTSAGEVPVRVLSVLADATAAERVYTLYQEPAQLTVPRGTGRLAAFADPGAGAVDAVVADAQGTGGPAGDGSGAGAVALDAEVGTADDPAAAVDAAPSRPAARAVESLPEIARFSTSFDPGTFTRESGGTFAVLPISASRAWGTSGTRLSRLEGLQDAEGLRLSISTWSAFSPSVSYWLYVFASRGEGSRSVLALEIIPRAASTGRGACILWDAQGGSVPQLIGEVATVGGTTEVYLSADDVASRIAPAAGEDVTVDLTAAWYDGALAAWEEFYYATFPLSGVPSTR